MRLIHVYHMCSVITTIMDPKLQLLKPLNKRELDTTWQKRKVEGNTVKWFLTNP
jgi:hypothetical protein